MAKPRKLWSQLADSTKKRYKRNGVTPQQYNAGKIAPDVRAKIYGKQPVSWAMRRANQNGLDSILKRAGIDREFKRLPKAERERIVDTYNAGLVGGRGNPFQPNGQLQRLNRNYEWMGPDFVVVPGEDGKEFYFRREWNSAGGSKLIPIKGYGHPLRSVESLTSEQDFLNIIEDQLGTILDESDLWNDERRSALEASSG